MSRLDRHVSAVRTRMTLSSWLQALAWAGIAYAIVVWAIILIDKLVQVRLPREMIWFWSGLGATVLASLIYAVLRRPTMHQAAVAIDERLSLKEKFSTALYARPSQDPFAKAAVKDAERTADNVSLHKRFPLEVPKAAGGTAAAVILVFLTAWLVPTFDLLGVQANRLKQTEAAQSEQRQAREAVKKAIARLETAPKAVADKQDIKLALNELRAMQDKPTIDPTRANKTAQKAEQDYQQALKDKIRQQQDYAANQEQMKQFSSLAPPTDDQGPLADAHRALAKGNFDQAVEDLSKAVNNFDKMDKKDQEKTAEQMKNLSNAIQKLANDQKFQQQVQKQLQDMGASQQQAQQIAKAMQQAANGDKQAQQQVQQAAKQLAQQANQKGGQSAQQQRQMAQQVQQAMQQMQQQANSQAAAQQLAQSSQALAQAMQQSAQGGQQGSPKQGNNGQMANKQANNQPGQQPGQQQGKQQMANAAKQMQQQLQQMQAIANDAQQVAAANGGQQGDGQGGDQPGGNKQGNNNQAGNGNNGGWNKGNNQQQVPANGQGGGVAQGNNRPNPTVAPFQVKNETDISDKNEKGKILASTFVKAGSIKGDAKMELHKVIPSVDKEATDEVDEQRIPRQDQDVVRGYFGNIKKDTEK